MKSSDADSDDIRNLLELRELKRNSEDLKSLLELSNGDSGGSQAASNSDATPL